MTHSVDTVYSMNYAHGACFVEFVCNFIQIPSGLLHWYWSYYTTDLLHKSHNAPVPFPTMHHFATEMCTCVHISATKWCTVGYFPIHCGICEMGLLQQCQWHNEEYGWIWITGICKEIKNKTKKHCEQFWWDILRITITWLTHPNKVSWCPAWKRIFKGRDVLCIRRWRYWYKLNNRACSSSVSYGASYSGLVNWAALRDL